LLRFDVVCSDVVVVCLDVVVVCFDVVVVCFDVVVVCFDGVMPPLRAPDFSPTSFELRLRRDQRGRKAAAPLETPRLWWFARYPHRNHEGRGRAWLFSVWSRGRSRS